MDFLFALVDMQNQKKKKNWFSFWAILCWAFCFSAYKMLSIEFHILSGGN